MLFADNPLSLSTQTRASYHENARNHKHMKRYSARRIEELDYLKAVMIILMVVFHLVYIGDHYVYAKQVVYTFHMPVFLVISGYLMSMSKPVPAFLRTMLWIAVPYLVMESAYVAMASVLPIREHIDVLTPAVFADKLLLHPIGPYWYLHTMLICGTVAYAVRHVAGRNVLSTVMVASLPLYILAEYAGVLSTSNALYFMSGVALQLSGLHFLQAVRPSWWAAVALAVLCATPQCLDRATIGGIFIVYLSMSLLLAVFPFIVGKARKLILAIGRNTLLVVLFSPIFTVLCKQMIPFLAFDSSRMIFLVLSTTITIAGSIAIGWIFDRLHLSPFFFGKHKIVSL